MAIFPYPFSSVPTHADPSALLQGGQAVACAAALANIEILQRERLVENAAAMGTSLLQQRLTL
jgi:4-aminobutyrate aminotransferase-like enzyme